MEQHIEKGQQWISKHHEIAYSVIVLGVFEELLVARVITEKLEDGVERSFPIQAFLRDFTLTHLADGTPVENKEKELIEAVRLARRIIDGHHDLSVARTMRPGHEDMDCTICRTADNYFTQTRDRFEQIYRRYAKED
jgi:hypothetical protein